MAKNIAQLMVDTLVQAGVERVYGLPGTPSMGLQTRFENKKSCSGFMSGMKRRQRLPPAPKHTLPDAWPSVREAAGRATCIWSMGFTIATEVVCRC